MPYPWKPNSHHISFRCVIQVAILQVVGFVACSQGNLTKASSLFALDSFVALIDDNGTMITRSKALQFIHEMNDTVKWHA